LLLADEGKPFCSLVFYLSEHFNHLYIVKFALRAVTAKTVSGGRFVVDGSYSQVLGIFFNRVDFVLGNFAALSRLYFSAMIALSSAEIAEARWFRKGVSSMSPRTCTTPV